MDSRLTENYDDNASEKSEGWKAKARKEQMMAKSKEVHELKEKLLE